VSENRDYYEVLGVDRDADARTIKRAFLKKARTVHPDVSDDPEAEAKFKELNEAYSVLSDEQKRANYDRYGTADGPGGSGYVDINDIFGGMGMDDLFSSFFGGGAGGVSFERTDGTGSLVEPGSGDASSGKTSEGSSTKASAAAEVYVDVDGAVVSPGVYRLQDGARVAQAIDAAGGLAPEADVTGLNRASKVVDGQKIHVPTVGEQQASIAEAGVDGGASASLGVSGATGLVNINTASAAELQTPWPSRLSMSVQRTVLLPRLTI
jgi:curved DNA-binding protein CbpA